MLIIPQKVKMKYAPFLKKYLEPKGYKFEWNADIEVDVEDLPINSNKYVKVQCDYCGKIYEVKYSHYNNSRNKIISKDCCYECSTLKTYDTIVAKYNVCCVADVPGVREKISKTNTIYDEKFVRKYLKSKDLKLIGMYKDTQTSFYFMCNKHHGVIHKNSFGNIYYQNQGCPLCAKEIFAENQKGYKNHNWKGGTLEISSYLRKKTDKWRRDSMNNGDFKCVATNKQAEVVHHLYGFNLIVRDTLQELGLPLFSEVGYYTNIELAMIEEAFLILQDKHGYGVCLTNEIHNNFHKAYGYGDNTPEQFFEFIDKHCA